MLGYSSSLRSLTAGTGSFDMKVHSFGVMNEDRIKSVIQEMRERVQIQHPELNQS
ncbi:10616_t:CDS:2 [Entrophospora sp. SA101]|nr:10616_t:CDS:2 [Entrophospora sp. SA101]